MICNFISIEYISAFIILWHEQFWTFFSDKCVKLIKYFFLSSLTVILIDFVELAMSPHFSENVFNDRFHKNGIFLHVKLWNAFNSFNTIFEKLFDIITHFINPRNPLKRLTEHIPFKEITKIQWLRNSQKFSENETHHWCCCRFFLFNSYINVFEFLVKQKSFVCKNRGKVMRFRKLTINKC